MAQTIIIGGGLTGLAAGRLLASDAHLVEAQDRLGGLARTDVIDGFWFDWTGHWLHLRTPRWKAEVDRLLPAGLLTIARQARIHSHGVWTNFPFQVNTHGLPPDVVAECLKGFIAAQLGPEGAELRAREPHTFREFVLRYLGDGIARHFMEPYNRKLYTVDTAELSAEWGGRFVPRPSLDEVIDGAVGRTREGLGYNASFVYPREGGIESIPRALARELACEISLRTKVIRIETARRRLHLSDGRSLDYRTLLSTMPLKSLVGLLDPLPPDVAGAAKLLRSVGVTVVEVGVKGPPRVPFHWAYFPEDRYWFYRVGSPSQVHAGLAPVGHTSYAAEFSHQGPPPSTDEAIGRTLEGLEAAGLIDRSDVVMARARTIPTAYVIVDHACAAARQLVLEHLASVGIEVAGRYGQWEYSGMEDALVAGEAAAERIAKAHGTPLAVAG